MKTIEFEVPAPDADGATQYSIRPDQIRSVNFIPTTKVLKLSWETEEGEQALELEGDIAMKVFVQLCDA